MTLGAVAGDDGRFARIATLEGVGLEIQAQTRFVFFRAMALEAILLQDRLDVVVKVRGRSGTRRRRDEQRQQNRGADSLEK